MTVDRYIIRVSELAAFEAGPAHPSTVTRKSRAQTHRDLKKYVSYGLLARVLNGGPGRPLVLFELTERGHQLLAILRGDSQ